MQLRVHQVAFGLGSGVLGASPRRMGVWTQGCSLRKCPGCASRQTWSSEGGKALSVESLLRMARAQGRPPSGLTVSGGEPTDQAAGVTALVAGFRAAFPGSEVVLYTGLQWRPLVAGFPMLVALLDVAVVGPYARTREATPLAGSTNQEVRLLTPLAQRLYQGWRDWPQHRVQVGQVDSQRLVTVGIPHTPDMALTARRLGAVATSWDDTEEGYGS
ncbi:Radical SAM domain protein [Thiorhodococcus drewsii AZ1]|uniref:Radical SAM domain protein n=1 Tax=Thiorhodococcus drewsii AZ1 TaxID=765913 RepID=G2DYP7_9GAMM|nr:4Fe-4S cluster-binding domain-containing protein [Thiorhodococcus drewsii]EGV32674.1 Radical SAM domain protein [Thiorhodococcus drewsii AZ1]